MSESLSNFDQYRKEFFERCEAIYAQRGNDYNRTTDIREYFIYGVVSIFQLIWAKALRLKSIMGYGVYAIPVKDTPVFEDTLIDLVVYASFAYAENKCRQGDHIYEPKSAGNVAIRYAEPFADPMERMVLEQESKADALFPRRSDHPYTPLHEACPPCIEYAERSRADNRRDNANVGNQSDPTEHAGATNPNPTCSLLRRRASDH